MIGKKQPPSTLLGLAFEGARIHLALVSRVGDSHQVQKRFSADLSASPLTGDPATLGAELKNALQQQSIREQKCVVALPVRAVLSLSTKIPELAETDVPDFLNMEAERNFAYDPESLFVSSSRCRFASGERYANIAGVQREQILNLQNVLAAARLKPLSFTVGIAALHPVFGTTDVPELLLFFGDKATEAGIACGEGLFAMRSLENTPESFDPDALGRELRVTFGQLPPELRGRVITARLFGSAEAVARAKSGLGPRLNSLGLAAEPGAPDTSAEVAAVAAAAGFLLGRNADFEFLPPKVSAWKQFSGTSSARKLGWAAAAAAAIVLLLLGSFLFQGWQLSNLESRWTAISPRVTELEDMQQQIKRFRPWFDNSFRSLTILKKLTEAFPVDGAVTAKTLEIRNQSQVTCSGTAKDNQAFFKMLDQLRGTREVAEVKTDNLRGKSPLQFSFNYRWVEGGTGEH